MIEKKSKNSIQWLGGGPRCNTREVTERLLSLKEELIELDCKEMELDQNLNWSRQSLINMMDDQNHKALKYNFVTHNQLRKIDPNRNTMVIQAPPNSILNVEAVKKSDLVRYGEEIDNIETLNKSHAATDENDQLKQYLFQDRSAVEFRKSINKIKMLRQYGHCNRIQLKSSNGPSHVFLLNNDLQQFPIVDDNDNESDIVEYRFPPFKKQKFEYLKKLAEAQRLEMETELVIAAEQLKNTEISSSDMNETTEPKTTDDIVAIEPEIVSVPVPEPVKLKSSKADNSKAVTIAKKSHILPSRHLSPRRAAQHHLFVPTSRTKDREVHAQSAPNKSKKERKISNVSENIPPSTQTQQMDTPILSQPIKVESTDNSSDSSNTSNNSNLNEIANNALIKEEIIDDNSQELSPHKISNEKKCPVASSQPETGNNTNIHNERSPLSQMQIKMDIDDLIIPDVYLPFLRLSPPASTQDYHFDLTNDEGICDLFF